MRRSPGSPSQMIAALFRRGAAHVAVEAVDAGVELCRRRTISRAAAASRAPCPTAGPFELAGEAGPERLGIAFGLGVDVRIVVNPGLAPERLAEGAKCPIFAGRRSANCRRRSFVSADMP